MRSLLVLFTAALFSIGVSACGGAASKRTTQTSHSSSSATATSSAPATTVSNTTSTQSYTKADADKDNDLGATHDDTNNNSALNYGHAASAADKRTVTEVVKRYFTAAAQGAGAKACSMLVTSLAEAVAEDYGHDSAAASYLSTGTTCPGVMGLLFEHFHSQLTVELPKLDIGRVRLVGHRGFAILNFGTMPERQIAVGREGRTWKIETLLDGELP